MTNSDTRQPFDATEHIRQKYEQLLQDMRDLRRAQIRYFKTRTKEDLIEAKELEQKMDRILFT